jgi:hypothetical protein
VVFPVAGKAKDCVWRVEKFLGLDRSESFPQPTESELKNIAAAFGAADLLVLDDANLGFRKEGQIWSTGFTSEAPSSWILLKMSRPIAEGKLWEHLYQQFAERLIVVMTVADLRGSEVQISRALSWEKTAEDLARELVQNPRVNALARCAHVVISFGTAGAFWLQNTAAANHKLEVECQLLFDPAAMEGTWEQGYPGKMIGYTSCLAAGIARQLMLQPKAPQLAAGITSGLSALRKLHHIGYGKCGEGKVITPLAFPLKAIAEELAVPQTSFVVATIPTRFCAATSAREKCATNAWTILAARADDTKKPLLEIARGIVLNGVEATLPDVPLGRFGGLLTLDRQEMESYRSIGALIREYRRQTNLDRPLSLAVFGAPGSGKSFGIVQVVKSIFHDDLKKLTFNLSQFNDPEQLYDAFHQIRDVTLSGQMPLVFWDEFDTGDLRWLAYFLAPMQDGNFQQGQITHNLGRAIFVFAGGTKARMEDFDRGPEDEAFRKVKGTDFISRLKGHINILGPNPADGDAVSDPLYLIRRAVLLRELLGRDYERLFKGKQLNIDSGVLRALLQTVQYKHGVRSMESLLAMSRLKGKTQFERSSLPPLSQLDLHVEGRDFMDFVERTELEGELLEKLAEAAHEIFCADLEKKGYKWGKKTDDKRKRHSALKPYAELPPEEQEQNRGNVRDIAHKLAAVGYVIVPARGNEPTFTFPDTELEQLAEMEHNRWMKAKLAADWRWAAKTDKPNQLHQDLLLWRGKADADGQKGFSPAELERLGEAVLPDAEKEKDRVLVRGIPDLLAQAGFTLAKLP